MIKIIFLVLFVLLITYGQFVNNNVQEVCESYVKETSNTQTFLYTDAFKACPDAEFATNYQLNCSVESGYTEYLRTALRMPAASPNISYNELLLSINTIGTQSNPCFLSPDSTDCTISPCNTITPQLDIGIISTRVYVKYGLNFKGNVPYSFFPVDSNTPIVSPNCNALAACQCTADDPTDLGPCNSITDPLSISANCGPNTDPNNGYSATLNKECTSICCSTCNLDPASQHRRWAVDPVCSVYTVTGPQLVTDIYVAMNNYGSSQEAIEAFIEASDATVLDTFVGTSDNPNYPIKGNLLRLYVNKVYSDAQSNVPTIDGLVILCDYGNLTNEMGAYNPYVTLGSDVNVPFDGKTFVIKNGRFRVPSYNAGGADLGAGKVPTQNSMAKKVSMFYLNNTMAQLFAQTGIIGYAQGQKNILNNYKTQNPTYEPPSWWSAYTGVPGWQMTTVNPIVPLVPSPCQMANSVNTYADNYNTAVINNGGDYTAAVQAAGAPSPYLMPNYRIDMPNWWPNEGKEIYFDIGTVLTTQQPTLELFLDILDSALIDISTNGLVDITSQSACIANITAGNGTAIAYLINTVPNNAINVDLTLQCNYTLIDPTTNKPVVYAATIETAENSINLQYGITITSAPFTFTFSNETTVAPVCIFTAVRSMDTSKLNNPTYYSQVFPCYLTLDPNTNRVDIINANQTTTNNSTSCSACDFACRKSQGTLLQDPCLWIPLSIGLFVLIVVAVTTMCCICGKCRKKNAKVK